MGKKLLILLILLISNLSISCTDYESIINEYGDGYVPYWIHEVNITNSSAMEYLVAYIHPKDLEYSKNNSNYLMGTDLIKFFSIKNGNVRDWNIDNYSMTINSLQEKVFKNEKIELGTYKDFFYSYDLNNNGYQEIIFPINAGGGQIYLQVIEYDNRSKNFKVLLNQKIDPFYDYALQTIIDEDKKLLKIFPDLGNNTRDEIEEGVFKQEFLIFDWDEDQNTYTVLENGFEKTFIEDMHW